MRLEPVPYTRPELPPIDKVIELVQEIWERGIVTNGGPVQTRFEGALVERLTWPNAAVVRNGTAAIQLLLTAVGVGSRPDRDEVVVGSFTHAATVQAVRSAGGRAVLADVEESTLTADPDVVDKLVTPRTAALLITHPFGLAADVEGLEQVSRLHGIPLVFDAAAAIGVNWRGRPLSWAGDGSAFSFHATKLLCAIEAGAVASPHKDLVERVRRLRNFGIGEKEADPGGTNGKADEFVSAVGLVALDHLDQEIAARNCHIERYSALLDEPWVTPLTQRTGATSNAAAFAVRLRTPDGRPLAADVARALSRDCIESRRYFAGRFAVASQPTDPPTPAADRARDDVLCLPLWGSMPDQTVARVAFAVRRAVDEI